MLKQIIVKNLSYKTEHGDFILKNLSGVFPMKKIGLVGKNGSGKTTLLKLIMGELTPAEGSVNTEKLQIAYCPQDYQLDKSLSIAQTLGLTKEDYKQWDVNYQIQKILNDLGLNITNLDRSISTLSGGEKVKLILSKAFLQKLDFIILDEPTNNLDAETRGKVYELIQDWNQGMLIVSHDRTLLSLMDEIAEISENGLRFFGSGFEDYNTEKALSGEALKRHLVTADKDYKKAQRKAHEDMEKHTKRERQGERLRDGSQPSIVLNAMKNRAQKTLGKLKKLHEKRIEKTKEVLEEIQGKIEPENRIYIDLPKTQVANGKLVLECKNLYFSYNDKKIFQNLNLSFYGPERVAILGKNGSGKTTLVKILTGELLPDKGNAEIKIEPWTYLDQQVEILDKNKTLLDNVKSISNVNEDTARKWLARFMFKQTDVFKKISDLSGGERIRAGLACVLGGDHPPKLLILDEPTNNLDIPSLEKIESALSNFQGAMLVISHDQSFLDAIGITKTVRL